MAELRQGLYSVNAGEISRYALGRIDLAKLRVACEREENFLPLVLGPAMMRPGTRFIARGHNDLPAFPFEFKKDENFAAVLWAFNDGSLQVLDSATDTFVTRGAVSAAITNGNFDSNITGWTNSSEAGASISWVTGGYLGLLGTGFNYAYADQQVTVTETGVEHALRIKITRGDVVVKIGGSAGSSEYWNVELAEGEYSLAFVPIGNFWVRFGARRDWTSFVDSIQVEAAGIMTLTHPWSVPAQYDESEDVIFVAADGLQQRRLERRNTLDMRSWGIALYRVDDGPFRPANLGTTTLTNSATTGPITLTANRDFFRGGMTGSLFRLTHPFQTSLATLAGGNQFTAPIRISGINPGRSFAITISGRASSTLTLQRSLVDPGAWSDVQAYVTNGSFSFDDGLDNQIYWYRIGIKTGDYGADTVVAKLEHSGSQTGIVRITGVTNGTSALANVLTPLGAGGVATADWAESEWSDFRGWPVAVALHDGRLFWQCDPRDQGSVSDAFHSFDDTVIGDSGPINRTTVASKPHWMVSTLRLLIGSTLKEVSVRASAFDEPLTATAFTPRVCSDRGSMQMRAIVIDGRVIFIGRDKRRVFQLDFDAARADFTSHEVTRLKQEMCAATVVDIAAQRQPDTRIYLVLGDGSVVVIVHEPNEDVSAMVPFTFSGDTVERVACLPGIEEDKVYLYVNRGGKRCIERFAMRSEAVGGTLNKVMDSHVVYSGAPTAVLTGLSHIEGRQVVAWADGTPRATLQAPLVVSGGQVNLALAASNAVVGIPYVGLLKTAKLAGASEGGTSLTTAKQVGPIGLVMADVAWQGTRIGRDFDHLTALPATYRGRALGVSEVLIEWDDMPASFGGGWGPDPRVCIRVEAPFCCTLMGIVFGEQINAGEDLPPPRER